jgi:proteasome lid subunit RPN8/RPN11
MRVFSSFWEAILSRLFPKVDSFVLQRGVLRTMREMALQTHPKEAFGVLRGSHIGSTLIVRDVAYQPFTNTASSAHVAINPYVLSDMVGTFHSHPSPNGEPSAADKRLFARHPGVHCIVPYPYTVAHVYNSAGKRVSLHKL